MAIALSSLLDCEIINLDSVQIYRGLDKGSAKPSPAIRARIPHHLIDVVDVTENYSAGQYARAARQALDGILARGRSALVVGGTMFYARVLLDGLADLPPAQPALRTQYAQQAQQFGWPTLHARLKELDPPTARRIEPQDKQRIMRALEIIEQSGSKIRHQGPTKGLRADLQARGLTLRVYGLMPSDRADLSLKIAQRFQQFLADGLVEEVRSLRRRGDLSLQNNSMRAVGYRQVWQYLEERFDYDAMVTKGITATRQMAKRQLTWLRPWPQLVPLDASEPETRLARQILADLRRPQRH